jgi:hypothetical protein
MDATLRPVTLPHDGASIGMGRKSKPATKPVRLEMDVAELAEKLAPVFGKDVPEYLSGLLRPILQAQAPKAAEILLDKPKKKSAE